MTTVAFTHAGAIVSFTAHVVPLAAWRRQMDALSRFSFAQFAGRGRISGTVKDKGTPNMPVRRRVRLYQDRDGLLVRETWSDATTGAYVFEHLDETLTYTVLSYDHTLNFRAVVADRIVSEPMQ